MKVNKIRTMQNKQVTKKKITKKQIKKQKNQNINETLKLILNSLFICLRVSFIALNFISPKKIPT